MRFYLSRKGHFFELVEAARYLTEKLLSHFDGFAQDNNGTFWDSEEITNGTKKNGSYFLEAELAYSS